MNVIKLLLILIIIFCQTSLAKNNNEPPLSVTGIALNATLMTASNMPHLVGSWRLAGMFEFSYAEVREIQFKITTVPNIFCAPNKKIEVRSSRGAEGTLSTEPSGTYTFRFKQPLRVARGSVEEIGIYTISENTCSHQFFTDIIAVTATAPKGAPVEILISESPGGRVTPSNEI